MRIQHHRKPRRRSLLARKKKPLWLRLLSFRLWRRIIIGFGSGALLFTLVYGVFFLPSVDNADQLAFSESTIIYDREALTDFEHATDHILYVIHGDENREYVPLEEISPWIKKATLAIEDDQFYHHFGFDVGGIVRAVFAEFLHIGNPRGGSTITQQLVKNTFLSNERTLTRKYKELLLAVKVELAYTKDEILEMYLNKIPYGSNAHGIEAASRKFFGKSARDLTLAESAVLASLPMAPTRFSPYGSNKKLLMGFYDYDEEGNKVYKKGRKDLVLNRMLEIKSITNEEFKDAWIESNNLTFQSDRTDIKAPHFVFYVRERLEEKFGKDFIKQGGLRVYTTLDPELQAVAEDIVATKSAHYDGTYGAKNVALASLDSATGEIMAYVGGKNYFDEENDGQVDVLTSRRQPGSSFKPYTYAAAFEKGFTPSTVVFDVETDFGANYTPQNFDGTFQGPVSFREALNRSLNIPAVKAAFLAGPANVLKLAQSAGVVFEGDADDHGVAVGIGVSEVEPLSHIAGYQVFAGDGSYHTPTAILEVRNSENEALDQYDPENEKEKGIDSEVAALVRNVLTDESTRPTTDDFDWNKLLQLPGIKNGAKTGTSNRKVLNPEFQEDEPEDEEKNPKEIIAPGDSWTIGFTPHLVTGVWVGNNKGEAMKPGATGLAVAAPIWKAFNVQAHEYLFEKGQDPERPYEEPTHLEVKLVNRLSGKLATDKTPKSLVREEVFASFSEVPPLDDSVKEVDVNRLTGLPIYNRNLTSRYNIQRQFMLELDSIRPDLPHWKNPVDDWIAKHPKFMTSLGSIQESRDVPSSSAPNDRYIGDPSSLRSNVINPPSIYIISPRDKGTIAAGSVEVVVSTQSKNGVVQVEYYLDDKLVGIADRHPFTGNFIVEANGDATHILKARAIDRQGGFGDAEIKVSIGEDHKGPHVIFLGPVGAQEIPIGSAIEILADINDYESGVKVAEFFVDGESLGFTEKAPYRKTFVAQGDLGRHELTVKAWDKHGNITEKSIPVSYTRQAIRDAVELAIDQVYTYRSSLSIDTVIPEGAWEWIELVAEQGQDVIYTSRVHHPERNAQFQIPKNQSGRTRLRLYGKKSDEETITEARIRYVEL